MGSIKDKALKNNKEKKYTLSECLKNSLSNPTYYIPEL